MKNITIEKIKDIIANNEFMNLRDPLSQIDEISSVDFALSPLAYYSFIDKDSNSKYIITNKSNVDLDGSEHVVGDIVFGKY